MDPTLDNRQFWHTVYRFNSRFFSGLDVRLFVNETMIDIALSLEFVVQEAVLPVYGYRSYVYDTVLRGSRTIQGTLMVPFIRPFYLFELIEQHTTDNAQPPSDLEQAEPVFADPDSLEQMSWKSGRVESILSSKAELRSRYWSTQQVTPASPADHYRTTSVFYPMFDPFTPVSLVIVYSDPIGRESEAKQFSVDTTYTLREPAPSDAAPVLRHIEVLSDIEFTGVARGVDDSGQVLREAYSFIARSYNDAGDIRKYARLLS